MLVRKKNLKETSNYLFAYLGCRPVFFYKRCTGTWIDEVFLKVLAFFPKLN